MKLNQDEVCALAAQFTPDEITGAPIPFGGGHINDTFLFISGTGAGAQKHMIQRINRNAFHEPEKVMENMQRVTDYLRREIARRGGDTERETLCLDYTCDGLPYLLDRQGELWRSYRFVDNTISYDRTEDADIFRESGRVFGRFHDMLKGFDPAQLYETIPHFHDTPKRFRDFREAVEKDLCGRACQVQDEIRAAMAYEKYASALMDQQAEGSLPLRVTHNDTKLNNVLMDETTGKGLCAIDLDTVMPGLAAYDFGDAIRFGASTALEDEQDLSKVHFSMELYRAYAEGYLGEFGKSLSREELLSLPMGARLMTLECLIRFLGDHLNGDVYFKVEYPGHNLSRARTQLKLMQEMDQHWEEMNAVVAEIGRKVQA